MEKLIEKYLGDYFTGTFIVTFSHPDTTGVAKEELWRVPAKSFADAEKRGIKYGVKEFGKDGFRIKTISTL